MKQEVAKTSGPRYSPPLKVRQLDAARLVALGQTDVAVAEQIGMNRDTIRWWRQIPAFREEVERRRAEVWQGMIDLRRRSIRLALNKVHEILTGDDEPRKDKYILALIRQAPQVGEQSRGRAGVIRLLDEIVEQHRQQRRKKQVCGREARHDDN